MECFLGHKITLIKNLRLIATLAVEMEIFQWGCDAPKECYDFHRASLLFDLGMRVADRQVGAKLL